MQGTEGPGGTAVNTLLFSQKTWENMGVGGPEALHPHKRHRPSLPEPPQATLCLRLGLFSPRSLQCLY